MAEKKTQGFTDAEKVAMKERAKELKAEAKVSKSRAEGEKVLLEKISEMQEPDKSMATRLHALITESAPGLLPRTWYGMPAYANQAGKVVLFFRDKGKF